MAGTAALISRARSAAGLARSLVIYRARPWKIARLATFYSSILAPGDLAFDIGAHVGNRTRAMLRAGARVVALEPQRVCFDFLRRDLPAEVMLLPLAAGPHSGRTRLAVSRLHPTVSSLAPGYAERMAEAPGFSAVRWDDGELVEVTTLDALIARHGRPRFVKIDVEGYEAEVLAGLSRPLPWIAFEYLPSDLAAADAAVERLDALGTYRFNAVVGEGARFALGNWQDADGICSSIRDLAAGGRSGDIYARNADA